MSSHEIMVMFLSLGLLLAAARFLGEMAKRLRQPTVIGEILAGILLGPTVLGSLAPQLTAFLFPTQGNNAVAFAAITTIAVALFLLVAGIELDFANILKQGKTVLLIGFFAISVPFLIGMAAAWSAPESLGRMAHTKPLAFAMFFATLVSVSALPVIAKILMDLNLYRSDMGMVVIGVAALNDLACWVIFAFILSITESPARYTLPVSYTIALTALFTLLMLTAGRWLIHAVWPWIQAHASWPSGVLSFVLSLALLGAAFTEWIGIHAIFGTFMMGIAIGDTPHLRERTRATMDNFISSFFAPLFFASIGLKMDFVANFDWLLTLLLLVLSCGSKIVGCLLGARLCRMAPNESLALAFCLNARGAMEIILGLVAYQLGIISNTLMESVVIVALATSLMSGPIMQRILKLKEARRFTDYMAAKCFIKWLAAQERQKTIEELTNAICTVHNHLDASHIAAAVWLREQIMPTGLDDGVAVPHTRVKGLNTPLVALGISETGIDFDAADGRPARIICLILTPKNNDGAEMEIIADIATTLQNREIRDQIFHVASYTEFLALMKTAKER
jgi:Kef-type K+ transport system membrane component KefB/mannitol/fructose-specific phosphotransferase system IIA component